jgi:glycosyl transferase, family 25
MNSLPDLFDATYLINLPERVDRLKSAKRQFARVHWDMGADGIRLFPAMKFADPAGFPNAPTRGCFQSHLECLRRAEAEGQQSVLILEDDIGLCSSLPRLNSSIKSQLLGREWDIVHFGHYRTGDISSANRNTKEGDVGFAVWTDDIIGAHFYAVGGRILHRLITHLSRLLDGPPGDPEAGPMSPDGAYNIFRRKNPDVKCLIACPKLGWQSSSRSDLTPRPFDRLAFLRPVNRFLRELKQIGGLWRS